MYMKRGTILIWILIAFKTIAQTDPEEHFVRIDSLEKIVYNTIGNDDAPPGLLEVYRELTELYKSLPMETQVEYGKRLLSYSDKLSNDEIKISVLELLANASFQIDDYSNSIEYYYRVFNLYNIAGDEINSARTLLHIGHNYYQECKYIKAKDYYERALLIFKRNQEFIGVAESLKSIAMILAHWGEYDKALKRNQEALSFCQDLGDKHSTASIFFSIGTIYQELGDLAGANSNFHKSLHLYEELNDLTSIVMTICHIGDVYLKSGSPAEALEYYIRADMISSKTTDKKLNAEVAYNIGKAYNIKGEFLKALDYQRKALRLYETIDNQKSITETYAELGLIYYNLGHYNKALFYLEHGNEIARSINYKYLLVSYAQRLSEVYAQLGDYRQAYANYLTYIAGRDEINLKERQFKTDELQAKYFLTVKQSEVDELKHVEQLNKVQIKNQQLLILFVIFILVISLILSIIFRLKYVQNQKLNIQLSLQKRAIEDQQHEMEELNINLKKANASKDKFFSIIAHDLKNPFNSLLGLSDLLIEDYDSLDESDRKEFIAQIKASGDRIYSLLQNLLIWGRSQLGKIVPSREKLQVLALMEETISITQPHANGKNISVKTSVSDDVFVFADKNMISTVLLNLVTNAIKFTPSGGEVEVHGYHKGNTVEIMVADTGIGISKENQEKLFHLDEKVQTDGTNKEKGTGLGLILCKDFIEKNDGRIWVESDEGAGCWICFTLPASGSENRSQTFRNHPPRDIAHLQHVG
ncbi:MAG: tetratricopeptide repeat-containing sensor histidine kinase [Bacteroidales bacterium]|nr:tetratricopeptide repeat-containing sensor histidine kinase [Bacteroidales bacterium]